MILYRIIANLCSFLIVFELSGQTNLIPNGSFESYSSCPNAFSQVDFATGWEKSFMWNSNPGGWHTEYVNSCNGGNWVGVPINGWGNQSAYNGNGYIAHAPACPSQQANYRENIFTHLATPLQIGATYHVSYRISLSDNCKYAANNVCVQLGTDSIFPINNQALIASPVVTSKTTWTKVCTSFVADSNYTFLALGNFFNDANTAYTLTYPSSSLNNAVYYIDSLQLYLIAPPPAPSIQSQMNCNNGSFSLSDTTGVVGVLWNFGDPASGPNNISTLFSPQHIFSTSGTYNVSVIVQYASQTDTLYQTVSASTLNTMAMFSVNNGPCGANINFSNLSTNYSTCLWDFGDGNNSTLIAPSHIYSNAGNYIVTLIANGPCGSDTIVHPVVIFAPPIDASFTCPLSVCTSENFNFTGIGWNANTYYWDFGDGDTSNVLSPAHSYSTPGNYTVTFIASNACVSDTVIHTISVIQSPYATIAASNDTICSGTQVSLVASGGSSVQWSGGSNSNSPTINVILNTSTVFYAVVSDSFCTSPADSIYITVELCMNVEGNPESNDIVTYPSPVINDLNIIPSSSGATSFTLYNAEGKIIYAFERQCTKGEATIIDMRNLPNGLYIITVQCNNIMQSGKIIISR